MTTVDPARGDEAGGASLPGRAAVIDAPLLVSHVGAALRFMPGITLEARGKLRRVHDVALVDWVAVAPDGTAALQGTNVVHFAAGGRIREVVGVA